MILIFDPNFLGIIAWIRNIGGYTLSCYQTVSTFCKQTPTFSSCFGKESSDAKPDIEKYASVEKTRTKNTPLKINMEHVLMEVWKIMFLSKWVMAVGSSHVTLPGCIHPASTSRRIYLLCLDLWMVCVFLGGPTKYQLPYGSWTLQWEGLNLYSRVRVLKMASLEGPMILRVPNHALPNQGFFPENYQYHIKWVTWTSWTMTPEKDLELRKEKTALLSIESWLFNRGGL